MKNTSRKNILKRNKRTKKRQSKRNKTKKNIGGENIGQTLYKYTLGEKRSEIIPQVKSIVKGVKEGYGVGGIGGWTDFAWDNGGSEYLLTVPLSSIILWHPVRGEGERAQAGVKTTIRADETYKVLMNTLSKTKDPNIPVVTYSRKNPLTFQQIDTIPEMASNDGIRICPVNINDNITDKENIDMYTQEITRLQNKISYGSTKNSNLMRILNEQIKNNTDRLQDLLYKNNTYKQYFLVLSGQGRLQAIIEAVKKANISPNDFYIKLSCKDIYLDICNVILKIHNTWVREGKFNDSQQRHEVYFNGRYIPMTELPLAFSCARNRSRKDTLCFSKYHTGNVRSNNMGCADIYDYKSRIPLIRYFTR
jgi:hypothetical protein